VQMARLHVHVAACSNSFCSGCTAKKHVPVLHIRRWICQERICVCLCLEAHFGQPARAWLLVSAVLQAAAIYFELFRHGFTTERRFIQ
jgi:hypothetical protein